MKHTITILLIAFTTSIFAQDVNNRLVFPISSETKYKDFVSHLILRSGLRSSAKITYNEKVITHNKTTENECLLLFDSRSCQQPKFNLLKKQDSIQYISDGYLLYTIFHKTKEVIIQDSVLEKGLALMRENPLADFYTRSIFIDINYRKNPKVSMFSNNEYVVINYPRKQTIRHRGGTYSYKFRACDFALSEQNCWLENENNIADLYAAKLISLEDENKFNFSEKDFDVSQWLDTYIVIDKRIQQAKR